MIPKFRAYSTEENEMYYPHNDKNVDWTIDDETGFIAPLVNLGSGMWGMIDKYELMQSTGLKDKNSVEIYEGDVVKWGDTLGGEETPIRIATVKIEPDILFDSNVGIFNYGQFAYKNTEKFLTILGNIYENPELLEAI
ncbi:YopX family protein [Enterococcus dongliensis]|uniref:YopX family protein n=1 Tax=Enterococcus dongliensis TaxID=2559925 RepID=UPI00288E00B1|nr:YopX family protein [Enterococcus dongliensis]MDT2613953.1 YopX family protein [Enterococcus dongliensis]